LRCLKQQLHLPYGGHETTGACGRQETHIWRKLSKVQRLGQLLHQSWLHASIQWRSQMGMHPEMFLHGRMYRRGHWQN
jgi:hypothetical protein